MTEQASLDLQQIGQIAIPVDDLDAAVAFYRDTLGLTLLFEAPPGLAFFDCGGVRLMLSSETTDGKRLASVLYYKTDDLEQACSALTNSGVPLESEPHLIAKMPDHELWMAFLRDPAGNLLALMSEIRP